ncbi:MAG: alkaline phosphatase family protein [Deltaproteobacteria bacterium]|nr:alkaline phosphatase family protein [Deltaproteobacteria bacterium]
MSARHLVIGLDGADVDVIERMGRDALPTLFALREKGAWARLRSVVPCATLPNWTTFLTGVDPGTHGVFDFTTRVGTRIAFTGGTVRAVPTIAARLDRLGLSCAIVGFPATFPPEPLAHGVFVSGWDSPVDFEADEGYVHPPSLHRELTARFGPLRFDEVDEFVADRPGWHGALGQKLEARVDARTELASHLLADRDWDLFAFYFGESDTASHHLYALWDESSPRHPSDATDDERDGYPRVYRALDRAVARLVEEAGPEVELTIVSDHGSGPSSDKVLYLNRALESLGFLAFRGGARHAPTLRDRLRAEAMQRVPPRMKHALFHAFGRALPGLLESRTRFAAIDFARTRVFSDELNYFPALHFNLRGREPEGVLDREDVPRVLAALEDALFALRDPWTNEPVVQALHARASLYEGPHVDRAPDVIVELALDRETRAAGATYNVMPSNDDPEARVMRRLEPAELRGRKGRSLAGSHRDRGLYLAVGPSVRAIGEIDARIADATSTLLARMGLAAPAHASGRVLDEVLGRVEGSPFVALPDAPVTRTASNDLARTEARLRALGYVD